MLSRLSLGLAAPFTDFSRYWFMTCRNELTGLGKALSAWSFLSDFDGGGGGATVGGGIGRGASDSDMDLLRRRLKNEDGRLVSA